MNAFRRFALPTIAGWTAGAITCSVLNFLTSSGNDYWRMLGINFVLSGVFIVLPGLLLVSVPAWIVSCKSTRRGEAAVRPLTYGLWLFFVGLATLCLALPVGQIFSDRPIGVFGAFVPLVPYAIVVAWLTAVASSVNPRPKT